MPEQVRLALVYDGEALRDGAMDVRDLGPALLALGDMIASAHSIVNAESAEGVSVRAQAEFKSGSFDVKLVVAMAAIESTRQLVMSPHVETIKKTLEALLKAGNGFMWLIKKLKGKPAKKVTVLDDGERVEVETEDTRVVVHRTVGRLYTDPAVRLKAAQVVSPLWRRDINYVEAHVEGEPGERVTKDDAESFAESTKDSEANMRDVVAEDVVTVIKPWLRRGQVRHKWKLTDARGAFNATIEDQGFLDTIESGELAVGALDVFRVLLKTTTTTLHSGRVKREFSVLKVLDHQRAPRQMSLLASDTKKHSPRPPPRKAKKKRRKS